MVWRTEWLPTTVFLSGEFHGQRRLVGYSPWSRKESNTTERLMLSVVLCIKTITKNRHHYYNFVRHLAIVIFNSHSSMILSTMFPHFTAKETSTGKVSNLPKLQVQRGKRNMMRTGLWNYF